VKNLVYTPADWPQEVMGDLYLPVLDEKSPVILLIHGGAWAESDNRYQMESIAKTLSRSGYAVFNVTYRLAPEFHFPAPVEDMLEAVKWLADHAETYRLNMQQLSFFGYSAGGHIAELAAVKLQAFESRIQTKLRVVVAGGTPHFLRVKPDFPLVREFIGVDYRDNSKVYHEASPVDQVGVDYPPVYIYHGEEDDLVPDVHIRRMRARLDALNVVHRIHWVKSRGHVGAFLMPSDVLPKVLSFLDEYSRIRS